MKRRPTVKPGELHAYYGIVERGEEPDIILAWGDGVSKREGAFLHYRLGTRRVLENGEVEKSFFDALIERGYDISTLRLSISKKVPK